MGANQATYIPGDVTRETTRRRKHTHMLHMHITTDVRWQLMPLDGDKSLEQNNKEAREEIELKRAEIEHAHRKF